MKAHLISSFLLRAPLLPLTALRRPGRALRDHPLGPQALALASPDLAAGVARGGRAAERAVERYGRRAAFRPTPHGLLAGVMMGRLGARTSIATGASRAHRTISWSRLAAIGRRLLDDPPTRAVVRLRAAPSLLMTGAEAAWLALPADDGLLEVRQAEVDEALAMVVAAATGWRAWGQVREAAGNGFADEPLDEDELDDYLLVLVDQGLLHFDLCPPLLGPPPLDWMRARLVAVGTPAAADARDELNAPGSASTGAAATLLHGGKAVLSRAAVARAAALAPLLFRLQEALAPPAAERALGRALLERLEGLAEIFGAGAFDVGALATGAYGNSLAGLDEEPPRASSPEPGVLRFLVDALTEAARARRGVIDLDPAALDELLPPDPEPEGPPTFELVLTPCQPTRGAPPGDDWLLGLHAPAGASWGRFAHALGAPMTAALAELAAAEREGDNTSRALDISYAPSAALADLCVHPMVRGTALALVSWPEGPSLSPGVLALSVDPRRPLALSAAGVVVRPSPLHRVRSTTAPPGIYRLLAGWSFVRQHAPWAFIWGALADLPQLPRVRAGGFVVAPASWRIPPAAALKSRGLRAWRTEGALPRHVQVGEGDELLLVDLDAPDAGEDLARHAGGRAYEIWPPLDRLADQGGRRVEAVVAVVRDTQQEISSAALAPAGSPDPSPGWTTYKLFGAEDRQDDVLLNLTPLIAEAQADGLIDRWHFLRYVEGIREHLRVRVRVPVERAAEVFARRLRGVVAPLRDAGAVVAVETAEYFPELARYGGLRTFAIVEGLFELDSELVLRLLSVEAESPAPLESDRIEWLLRGFDALARGLGLELATRQALAARRRAAHLAAGNLPTGEEARALDAEFRARQRRLAGLLAGTAADACSAPLDAHATRVKAVIAELTPEAIAAVIEVLPSVLHLNAARLLGAHPAEEAAAYVFWERTLEGLAARRRRGV